MSAGGVFRVGVVRDDCEDISLRHKHVAAGGVGTRPLSGALVLREVTTVV